MERPFLTLAPAPEELRRNSIRSQSLHRLVLGAAALGSAISLLAIGGSPVALAANPAGYQVLAADGVTGTVYVEDPTSQMVTPIPAPTLGGIQSIALSPDGSRLYVAFKDGLLGTIDTASDSYLGSPVAMGLTGAPVEMVVNPDGRDLLIAESGSGQVVELDARSGSQIGTPIATGAVLNLAISPDGKTLFVDGGSGSSSVMAISIATTTGTTTGIPVPPTSTIPLVGAGAMVISGDGSSLYVLTSSAAGPQVVAIDPSTDRIEGAPIDLRPASQPSGLALSPDGRQLYVTDATGQQVVSIDTTTSALNSVVMSLPAGTAPHDIAITPDGSTAYVDGTDSAGASVLVPLALATGVGPAPINLPGGTQPAGLVIAPVVAIPTPTPTPAPTATPTPTPSPTCGPIMGIGPGPVGPPVLPPTGVPPVVGFGGGSAVGSLQLPSESSASSSPLSPPLPAITSLPALPPVASSPPLSTVSPLPEVSPGSSPKPIICFDGPVMPAAPGAAATLARGTETPPSGGLILRLAVVLLLLAGGSALAAWRFGLSFPRPRIRRHG